MEAQARLIRQLRADTASCREAVTKYPKLRRDLAAAKEERDNAVNKCQQAETIASEVNMLACVFACAFVIYSMHTTVHSTGAADFHMRS